MWSNGAVKALAFGRCFLKKFRMSKNFSANLPKCVLEKMTGCLSFSEEEKRQMRQHGIPRNQILIEQTNPCPDLEQIHFLKDNQRPQRDEQDDQPMS